MPSSLLGNIEEIARYTQEHPELRAAHHWLYDSVYSDSAAPKFVVMGVNPGETDQDWIDAPTPSEETSRQDFHPRGKGKGGNTGRWAAAARRMLRDEPYVLAEVFLWSSRDGSQFVERYGPLRRSPHLAFCTMMNRRMIEHYQPRAVVVSGLGLTAICPEQYALELISSTPGPEGRLIEHYSDGHRPWIFTKHFSAARKFDNQQRDRVAEYITSVCVV